MANEIPNNTAARGASKKHQLLSIIASLAIVIGPIILLVGYNAERTLEDFQHRGTIAKARVIGKRIVVPRRRCISVSYFDAPLLKGGKLQRVESCDYVFGSAWPTLKKDDHVEILFLPQEPGRFILKSALSSENRPLLYNMIFGAVLIAIGLLVGGLARLRSRVKG